MKTETAKKDLEFQAQPKKTGKIENVGEIGLSQWVLLGAGICRPRQPNTMDKYYIYVKETYNIRGICKKERKKLTLVMKYV